VREPVLDRKEGIMDQATASIAGGAVSDQAAQEWAARFLAAWNSHDPTQLTGLATADVFWEDPFIHPDGSLRGKEALRDWVLSVWRAFPDLTFELVGQPFVSLDRRRIGAAWRGRARHTGRLDPPGFAATGALVDMSGFDVHELRDGLVCHVVTTTDTTTVARQIGAAPPPNSAGERVGLLVQRAMAARMRRQRSGS
jgi:steroid delta-isomerase-like uncharacterized protein